MQIAGMDARQIALAAIDLAEPALVFPRAATDENILRGEFPQTVREVVARERVGVFKERTYHACIARK